MTISRAKQTVPFVILRVSIAIIFLSHAVVRVINGTIPRFGDYLDSKGFLIGVPLVYAITTYEIVGGMLLAAGYFIRILSIGFFALLLAGVIIIHAAEGWWVGEHGSGGMEYSFILMVVCAVLAATARTPRAD